MNNRKQLIALFFAALIGVSYALPVYAVDTDGDGVDNGQDLDDDNDGILDEIELPAFIPKADKFVADGMILLSNGEDSALSMSFGDGTVTFDEELAGAWGQNNFLNATPASPVEDSVPILIEDQSPDFATGYTLSFEFGGYLETDTVHPSGIFATIGINAEGTEDWSNAVFSNFDSDFLLWLEDTDGTARIWPYETAGGFSAGTALNLTRPFQAGDTFAIVVTKGGTVSYQFNGVTFYTGAKTAPAATKYYIDGGFNGGSADNPVESDKYSFTNIRVTPGTTATDTDSDGIVDALDIDSDNDGILDNIEAQTDAGYTAPNADTAATYTTNNGVNSAYLGGLTPEDTDSGESTPDNIPDYLDLDSDDDGIPDNVEWQPTTGYQAPTATDADDDGWRSPYDSDDATWGGNQTAPEDSDSDTARDYRDTDSDGDAALDSAEGGSAVTGISYADPNGSVDDPAADLPNESGDTSEVAYRELGLPPPPPGPSGGGIDLDSDNDGILDSVEDAVPGTTVTVAIPNTFPLNNAGFEDTTDAQWPSGLFTIPPTSVVGQYQWHRINEDITNSQDGTVDTAIPGPTSVVVAMRAIGEPSPFGGRAVYSLAGSISTASSEGIRQRVDGLTVGQAYNLPMYYTANGQNFRQTLMGVMLRIYDTDGLTLLEQLITPSTALSVAATAADWEQHTFSWTATQANVIIRLSSILETSTTRSRSVIFDAATEKAYADSDGDGIRNSLDLDSDNDGISDLLESGADAATLDPDNNGIIDGAQYTDADDDGLADAIETLHGDDIGTPPVDTDGNGTDDYVDLDSDGDGIPDAVEAQLTADYAANFVYPSSDSDEDGVLAIFDTALTTYGGTFNTPQDTDGDATFDFRDTDSDGDINLDSAEGGSTVTGVSYADPNGSVNDPAADLLNESGDTSEVAYRELPPPPPPPGPSGGAVDLDTDNDGISDSDEGIMDGRSASTAFTSLGMTRNVTVAGIYYFNLGGNAFSTYVDANGYVQVAIDFGDGAGDLPAGTALTSTTRGVLNATALASLTDANEIRISHSGGVVDVTNTDARLLSLLQSNRSLHRGTELYAAGETYNDINSTWVGTGASRANTPGSCASTTDFAIPDILSRNVYHICGPASGTRSMTWILGAFNIQAVDFAPSPETYQDILATETLNLWVRADTVVEVHRDTDGDVIPDYLDLDSDNDGISDLLESGADAATLDPDNNGIIDGAQYTDADNDGLADTIETINGADTGTPSVDTDSDGTDDYIDLDSDGDGIPDAVEAQLTADYAANFVYPSTDTDEDGVLAIFDSNDAALTTYGGTFNTPQDTDGDATFDFRDTDSDGDTILDSAEGGSAVTGVSYADPNGSVNDPATNLPNGTGDTTEIAYREVADDDGDGIPNASDQCPGHNDLDDRDSDGVPDSCDIDTDNDGISDSDEGIMDGRSASTAFTSLGMARNVTVAGIYNFNLGGTAFSTYVDANGYVQVAIDFGDGAGDLPAGTALTSTTRGVLNATALVSLTGANEIRISHSGGIVDVTNTDARLLSLLQSNRSLHRGTELYTAGVPYNDINSTWVGTGASRANTPGSCASTTDFAIPDILSRNVYHICGPASGTRSMTWILGAFNIQAVDFAPLPETYQDILATETLNLWVRADTVAEVHRDTDGDVIPDYLDLDSDNDGISDLLESGADAATHDPDNNGIIDGAQYTDADDDGLADAIETLHGDDTGTPPVDTDGNGTDDYIDLDSDGDGIPDAVEAQLTADYAANFVYPSTDTDDDGVLAIFDSNDAALTTYGGTFNTPQDTDGDATFDFRDTDSDGDTNLDSAEGGSTVTGVSYADPNGSVDDPTIDLPNGGGDTSEVAYREESDIIVSGTVWNDNGVNTTTDATAHNGDGGSVNDGASQETGIGGVPVAACLSSDGTVLASGTTNADGGYELIIDAAADGQNVDIVVGNAGGYLSVSEHTGPASPVLSGLDNSQASISCNDITAAELDTLRFTPVAGGIYPEIDFGDVLPPVFEPDHEGRQQAGGVALYPHVFTAHTTGDVTFTVASTSNPASTGWATALHEDSNCNGELDTVDAVISGTVSVVAEQPFCLIAKVAVPADAVSGSQHQMTITADFDYLGTSVDNTQRQVTDLTRVIDSGDGALVLVKRVENMTATSPHSDAGVEQTINAAQPGDELRYVIYFRNSGLEVITDVTIFDSTPAFTALASDVACPSPLPASLTTCTVVVPDTAANDPDYEGPIEWSFEGALDPGVEGSVEYRVIVQ